MSIIRNISSSIYLTLPRALHLSATCKVARARDLTDLRRSTVPKKDTVEGEVSSYEASGSSFEYVDENLMERLFDNIKYKDIPIMYLKCTRNNTKMHISDGIGRIKVAKTTGTEGFKNCRKGTTVAAQAVANRVVNYAKDHGINMVRLVFNGLGPGRGAAYKVVELSGLKVVSLSDRTEAIEPWIKRPRAAKSL